MTNYWAQDTETLAAAAAETVVYVKAPAGKAILVDEISVSFNDVDAADAPVLVELIRFTTDATGTGLTEVNRTNAETSGATALGTITSEGTAGNVVWSTYLTPAGGALPMQWPLGKEIVVPAGERIGIRCTTAAGVTPGVLAGIGWVE